MLYIWQNHSRLENQRSVIIKAEDIDQGGSTPVNRIHVSLPRDNQQAANEFNNQQQAADESNNQQQAGDEYEISDSQDFIFHNISSQQN